MSTTIYREQHPQATTYAQVTRPDHTSAPYMVRRVLYLLLDILETVLAVRVVLRLLAANPGSPFVNFMYNLTDPLVAPFRGIFPRLSASGYAVDWAGIVAMIVYALIVYAIVRLAEVSREA